MKLASPLPHRRGRLEIIPLIDIMFFLLAAFMIVSIGKIRVKSLKINLPTDVPVAQKETKEDFICISLNEEGNIQINKEILASKDDLLNRLKQLYALNKDQKFLLSADREARHGDVIDLLGKLRQAGFQKIGFSIKGEGKIPLTSSSAPSAVPPTVSGTPVPSTTGTAPLSAEPSSSFPETPSPTVPASSPLPVTDGSVTDGSK